LTCFSQLQLMLMKVAGQRVPLTPVTPRNNGYLGGYIGNIQFEGSKRRFPHTLRGGPDDTSTS
jgi:hypothetical protein